MSLLTSIFQKKKVSELAVLIDISTDSVAGAYAEYAGGEQPVMHYTRRLPIEIRKGEPHSEAMIRALKVLGDALIGEGAPILVRETGKAAPDTILVSVDAPWQTTSIRTEEFDQDEPFVFTKGMVAAALKSTSAVPEGKLLADESIIGTILNGYETRDPYGKKAHRASVIILTSLIDQQVAIGIQTTLRNLYHKKSIFSIAGTSLRYQALRIAFPHERDALILDTTGPLTSVSLVRRDLLMDTVEILADANKPAAWLEKVSGKLAEIAQRFPLPHTIFLIARESDIAALRKTLDAAKLGSLWLSDNPPKIVALLGSHIVGLVRQATTAIPDLPLLLMALYCAHRTSEESVL